MINLSPYKRFEITVYSVHWPQTIGDWPLTMSGVYGVYLRITDYNSSQNEAKWPLTTYNWPYMVFVSIYTTITRVARTRPPNIDQ